MRAAIMFIPFLLFACFDGQPPHNPQRLACMHSCALRKDACILEAQTPAQIEWCDGDNKACTQGCPQ